jgi:hypothetical protein
MMSELMARRHSSIGAGDPGVFARDLQARSDGPQANWNPSGRNVKRRDRRSTRIAGGVDGNFRETGTQVEDDASEVGERSRGHVAILPASP